MLAVLVSAVAGARARALSLRAVFLPGAVSACPRDRACLPPGVVSGLLPGAVTACPSASGGRRPDEVRVPHQLVRGGAVLGEELQRAGGR